ncbi:MAG: DUF58 domain-containing protein [Nitrososphaeria archaeon]
MTKINPTSKGKTLSYTLATLTVFYVIFRDPIILTATIATFTTLLVTLLLAILRARSLLRKSKPTPGTIRLKTVAGTVEEAKISLENPKKIRYRLEHPIRFIKPKREEHLTNEQTDLEIKPQLAGIYISNTVTVQVASPLQTFTAIEQIPYKTEITVIPRIVPALIGALKLMAAMGALAYEHPIQLIGRGTEYAETREYMLGDDIRWMDWKATARLQKPMIKQYHQETGGATNLVYDRKAAGPITRDEIATTFLNTATALSSQGIPYSITEIDESNGISIKKHKGPREALATAITQALKTVEVDYKYLYEYLEPKSKKEIVAVLEAISKEHIREEKKITTKDLEDSNSIVVSCLLGEISWLIELHERQKMSSRSLTVYASTKTWLDSEDLEQSYQDYQEALKIQSALKKRGIEIKQI